MTHTISFTREGEIYLDVPDGVARMTLTDKAYEKIIKDDIRYIYELLDDFDGLPDGRFGLEEENPMAMDILDGSLFTMRIKNIPKLRPDLIERNYKDIDEALAAVNTEASRTTRLADAVALIFLSRTKPIWTINELTAEAATLISKAKLDDEIVKRYIPKVKEGLYLKAKSGLLTTGASEIIVINDLIYIGRRLGKRAVMCGEGDEEDLVFCAKFLALQDSENKPIVIKESKDKAKKQGFSMIRGVNTRTISLSSRYIHRKLNRGEKVLNEDSDFSWKEGKIKTVVSVSGFIREQAYGKERKLRKTIWVDGFERGQWVRQGLTIVTIKK